MVQRNGYRDGEPCWADVIAPDTATAREFYEAVFGWTFTSSGPEFGGYLTCHKDGQRVAGITPPSPGSDWPPMWNLYFWADDADAMAVRIGQHGGKLMVGPMDITTMGRMVYSLDPAGAGFGVWQPGDHRGSQRYNEPGAMSWVELSTRDGAAADTFYHHVFDYEVRDMAVPDMDYATYELGGTITAGRMVIGDDLPAEMPANWLVYFGSDDVDAAAQRASANGGSVRMGPMDSPYGRWVILADPNGATFGALDESRRLGGMTQ